MFGFLLGINNSKIFYKFSKNLKVFAQLCFKCGKDYEQNVWKHEIFSSL